MSITSLQGLAAELESHWVEIGRHFLSRREKSRLHHGVAGDLSPVQLQALAIVEEGPLRMGKLADRLGLAESSVTRMVDRLESNRLVSRLPHADDRRAVAVQLTPAGRKLSATIAESRREYLAEILSSLRPVERKELIRLFAKVAAVQRNHAVRDVGSARRIS